MEEPTYMFVMLKYGLATCYSRGFSVFQIRDLPDVSIMRLYPTPVSDLTPAIGIFQRRWRQRRALIRRRISQLRYREIWGSWPFPLPLEPDQIQRLP